MVDETAAPVSDDMSGGSVPPAEAKGINARLALDQQKLVQRTVVFFATVGMAFLLLGLFVKTETALSSTMEVDPSTWIGWPTLLLCTSTLLGSITLVLTAMRIAFRSDVAAKEEASVDLPQAEVMKLAIEIAKLMKPGKGE